LPLLVGGGVLLLTLWLWHALSVQERAQMERLLRLEAASVQNELIAQLQARILGLVRLARSFEQDSPPSREQWDREAALNLSLFPGYDAIAWMDPELQMRWVTPLAEHEAVQALALALAEQRPSALEAIGTRREVTVTHVTALGHGSKGFVAYVPSLSGETFNGIIVGVFRVQELLEAILHGRVAPGYTLAVFDDGQELYRPATASPQYEQAWGQEVSVTLYGLTWRVRVWPGPRLLAQVRSPLPALIVGGGILLAGLVALSVHLLQTARLRTRAVELANHELSQEISERQRAEAALQQAQAELEHRVQERTAALSHTNAALQQEIAARQGAEEALRHERNLLQVTLVSIGDAVVVTDPTATLTFLNPVAEQLTGWTAQEASGRKIGDLLSLRDEHTGQPVESPVETVLREGSTVALANHTVLSTRDGREVPIAQSGAPIRGDNGQVYGTVLVLHDVTKSRQSEAALRQAKEAAEAADRAKSEFLATVSHELRTPLYIILSYIDFLVQGEFGSLQPEQQQPLRAIQRSAAELYELIIGMLDFSQLQREGQLPMDLRAVPLPLLFAALQQETHERYAQSGLEFVWSMEPALPPLWTDLDKLKTVLRNLLGNAVKFTSAGRVTVAASVQQGGVEISVSDTGPGIPPEALPVIFEPFRQGDSSLTRPYGGVGLGPYIVKSFLTLLGGRITVESEVGRGSTFRVWLPLSPEPAAA
jgi:PAS domain S-box-containing protein